MIKFNYEEFKTELKESSKTAFTNYINKVGEDNISGLALATTEDFACIDTSYNTFEHLKKEQIDDPKYSEDSKWCIGEWEYEAVGEPLLDKVSKMLQDISLADTDDEFFEEHCDKMFTILVDVLVELKQEGVFDKLSSNAILRLDLSDYVNPPLEIEMMKKINNSAQAKEFEKWILSWATEEDDDND